MGCRFLDYIMWTVKEEGSKEHDFQLDLVHPILMVSWTIGVWMMMLEMMLENFITTTIQLCQVQWNRKWLK